MSTETPRRAGVRRTPRWRQALLWVVVALVLLGLVATFGIGWYFSSQALTVGTSGQSELTVSRDVSTDEEGRVVLSTEGYAEFVGRHGVRVPAGSTAEELGPDPDDVEVVGIVGDIVEVTQESVVREWEPVEGELPAGPVRGIIDQDVFWPDPSAVGVPFTETSVTSDVGELPAWLVEGEVGEGRTGDAREDGEAAGSTWAIFVHGRGGTLEESLRYLPALRASGVTTLVTAYRNDPGAPPDPSGQYRFGETEWRDVEAAVAHSQEEGAERVLLLGWSMGAAISLQALDRSPETAAAVTGLWLDSPALDWDTTFDTQGRLNGLPQPVTDVAKWLIERRAGMDFADYDWVARAEELPEVPIHIEHSRNDTYVPNASAVELATARPDLVTLVQDSEAEHTRVWNADPSGYDARLTAWLAERLDD